MLSLAQMIEVTDSKKAAAARDVDYIGSLIHAGYLSAIQQTSQDALTALYAEAGAQKAAYTDVADYLTTL